MRALILAVTPRTRIEDRPRLNRLPEMVFSRREVIREEVSSREVIKLVTQDCRREAEGNKLKIQLRSEKIGR